VFIDDDDSVSPFYLDLILEATQENPDYIGFKVLVAINGFWSKETCHSLKYDGWYEDDDRFYRDITHINPIKREKIEVRFPPLGHAEDKFFVEQLRGKLKTEVFIPEILYFYNFNRWQTLMDGDPTLNIPNQDTIWKMAVIDNECIRYI
jgi:hypothetical protein